MNGTYRVTSYAFKCSNPRCKHRNVVYKSGEAEFMAPKYRNFGLDVIVEIGYLRFREKRMIDKITEISRLESGRMKLTLEDLQLWDLLQEAAEDYQEGCFRSCIFVCAEIVEQVIKHELIRNSEDPEEKQWQLEIEGMTFGKLIEEAKKLEELKGHIADAQWLNDARNTIAVHPLYVGVYEKDDDLQTRLWKNRTMIRNIRKTLKFLNERDREIVLESELRPESGEKFIKLRDMLEDPTSDRIFVMWDLLSKDMLERLALEAYSRMKKVVVGVYPADKVA